MIKYRLKRKYLIIFTILITILSLQLAKIINIRITQIKKEIEQCDHLQKSQCSIYELRQYTLNK